MKLTITKKPFKGKPVGAEIELNDRQARLLTKMGRAQYMTRDMVAAPPSFRAAEPEPAAPPVLTEEMDATGAVWDETVHSRSRLKNADGTWRKRPGARPADGAEPPAEQ